MRTLNSSSLFVCKSLCYLWQIEYLLSQILSQDVDKLKEQELILHDLIAAIVHFCFLLLFCCLLLFFLSPIAIVLNGLVHRRLVDRRDRVLRKVAFISIKALLHIGNQKLFL